MEKDVVVHRKEVDELLNVDKGTLWLEQDSVVGLEEREIVALCLLCVLRSLRVFRSKTGLLLWFSEHSPVIHVPNLVLIEEESRLGDDILCKPLYLFYPHALFELEI